MQTGVELHYTLNTWYFSKIDTVKIAVELQIKYTHFAISGSLRKSTGYYLEKYISSYGLPTLKQ